MVEHAEFRLHYRIVVGHRMRLPSSCALLLRGVSKAVEGRALQLHRRVYFRLFGRSSARLQDSLAIWTNCPVSPGAPFQRYTYHRLEGSDEG
jgi:hypothetical protein